MKSLLCTLGPASLSERVIKRLEGLGVSLFRINLSHTRISDLPRTMDFVRGITSVPICLDTEGAQIRTGDFADERIDLRENSIVRASRRPVPGDGHAFNFNPLDIVDRLEVGDFISIDFNAVLVQVIDVNDDGAIMRVLNGGSMGRNKAVTVERDIPLAALTGKDREAIRLGRTAGIKHYALSFASGGHDVDEIRGLAGSDTVIISKIESLKGLQNLEEIAGRSDAVLIDRGDLSRQIPIERIPETQKDIIRRVKLVGTTVYVATNLLESMVTQPTPTRAEVNDVHNTLLDGADGLVLAAETAIGRYPLRCADMVMKMIRAFERTAAAPTAWQPTADVSLLVAPHGGELVNQFDPSRAGKHHGVPAVVVADTVLMDCQQIAFGTYSPLRGFMDSLTLATVLKEHRLPDGSVWTLPILLQVDAATADLARKSDRLFLTDRTGMRYALLDVSEVHRLDLERVARLWFGTTSLDHPGVARLMAGGPHAVAGTVWATQRLPSSFRHYDLTPAQTRFVFARKGWSRVVGFHGRNVAHRVHEYIQLEALRLSGADGLYVSPVIGPKKSGDFLAEPIMKSYQILLDFGFYPRGQVVLGTFATYSRYSGPREAVFTALCRKNMGCSHFIVGRDHTGVGNFYPEDANRRLFDQLGELGIAPVFFDNIGYDSSTGDYRVVADGAAAVVTVSGTEIRERLRDGTAIPDWVMRSVVQEMLRHEMEQGRPIFCE